MYLPNYNFHLLLNKLGVTTNAQTNVTKLQKQGQ